MLLTLTKEQLKNFKSLKNDYEFGPSRLIQSIANEIRLLQKEGYSITEIASILKVELKYEITPGNLRKILSRMKKVPTIVKNKPKDESKRVEPPKEPEEGKIKENVTHKDDEYLKVNSDRSLEENTDRSHDPNHTQDDDSDDDGGIVDMSGGFFNFD